MALQDAHAVTGGTRHRDLRDGERHSVEVKRRRRDRTLGTGGGEHTSNIWTISVPEQKPESMGQKQYLKTNWGTNKSGEEMGPPAHGKLMKRKNILRGAD